MIVKECNACIIINRISITCNSNKLGASRHTVYWEIFEVQNFHDLGSISLFAKKISRFITIIIHFLFLMEIICGKYFCVMISFAKSAKFLDLEIIPIYGMAQAQRILTAYKQILINKLFLNYLTIIIAYSLM